MHLVPGAKSCIHKFTGTVFYVYQEKNIVIEIYVMTEVRDIRSLYL